MTTNSEQLTYYDEASDIDPKVLDNIKIPKIKGKVVFGSTKKGKNLFMNSEPVELSLCPNCNCMTKTINGKCGKCGCSEPVDEQPEQSFYRDKKGKLMCSGCNTEVFGGLCECTDYEKLNAMNSESVDKQIDEILALVRDAGVMDCNHGGEDWTFSDKQITKAKKAIQSLIQSERQKEFKSGFYAGQGNARVELEDCHANWKKFNRPLKEQDK